jgi:hypothetical protein
MKPTTPITSIAVATINEPSCIGGSRWPGAIYTRVGLLSI